MEDQNQMPQPIPDTVMDRVSFNTEAAAALTKADFIAEHKAQWPELDESKTAERLGQVHDAAVATMKKLKATEGATQSATQQVDNGNNGSTDAGKAATPQSTAAGSQSAKK